MYMYTGWGDGKEEGVTAHVYKEGIVRFAPQKYAIESEGDLSLERHLTFIMERRTGSASYKEASLRHVNNWSFADFAEWLSAEHKVDWDRYLWPRILTLLKASLVVVSPAVRIAMTEEVFLKKKIRCFELFGYDILIDEDMKPWLLEVNSKPGMYSAKNNKRARRLKSHRQLAPSTKLCSESNTGRRTKEGNYADREPENRHIDTSLDSESAHGALKSTMLDELFAFVPGAGNPYHRAGGSRGNWQQF